MSKTKFEEMYSKNVQDKVEKKNGLSYLSWAYAWAEVKKIDENASYEIHEDANGNAFFASQLGIDCKVSVTIHGRTHTMRLPVMDGANKAMKTEEYSYKTKYDTKTVAAANAFDVNKTIMRCLVKAIAMHGLGLYIYAGEDLPEETGTDVKNEAASKSAGKLKAEAGTAGAKTVDVSAIVGSGSGVSLANGDVQMTAANPENNVTVTVSKGSEGAVVTPKKAGWGQKKVVQKDTKTDGALY